MTILAGMRVVEASAFVAAPLGGMTLAQLGADVIRIDPLGGGLDYARWPVTESGTSLFWCGLNKSKRSVALDIFSAEGRELAMAIITAPGPDAGIFLTNFPPRGWLAYETLREKRADLIQLTIQGDRHGGSAVDYTVNAKTGLPYLTGLEGAVNHVLPAWDLVTGQMAATGLLAAERHRSRTGAGQHVKLALEDVALAVMGHLGFIAEAEAGVARGRHGNDLYGAFGRDFCSADGARLMLIGLTARQWSALCAATGLGKEMEEKFSAEGDRFHARREIAARIAAWIAARNFAEIKEIFKTHGVCFSRYQSVSELVANDPACSPANPMFSRIDQPGAGHMLAAGPAFDFSGIARQSAQPAPVLGQHTEEILYELLGLSQAAYGRLRAKKIVAGAAQQPE